MGVGEGTQEAQEQSSGPQRNRPVAQQRKSLVGQALSERWSNILRDIDKC